MSEFSKSFSKLAAVPVLACSLTFSGAAQADRGYDDYRGHHRNDRWQQQQYEGRRHHHDHRGHGDWGRFANRGYFAPPPVIYYPRPPVIVQNPYHRYYVEPVQPRHYVPCLNVSDRNLSLQLCP